MKADDSELQRLFQELEHYEQRGVRITLEGSRVSPMQIVNAYLVKESGSPKKGLFLSVHKIGFSCIAYLHISYQLYITIEIHKIPQLFCGKTMQKTAFPGKNSFLCKDLRICYKQSAVSMI